MVSNDVHVVDIKMLSTDDRYVHSFKVVIYRKHAEKVMEDDFWPVDVDLLYSKEKQLIIIINKLNLSTLNCEGLRRSKHYTRTYLRSASSGRPLARSDWKLWWAIGMYFDGRLPGDWK